MVKAKSPVTARRARSRGTVDRRARTVTVEGCRLTLLTEGPDLLDELLALIDGAKHSLRLLYYIYQPDRSGGLIRAGLLRAVERGVDVCLLVDGFGANELSDNYFIELTRAGARFCRFIPRWGRRYLLRNHQKMALADAESGKAARMLIGGFNIADDYFGTTETGAWRDIGLIVEGPAAARLATYYDRLFDWATIDNSSLRLLRQIIFDFSETKGKLQWQMGGPTAKLSPWGVSTCRDLVHSRDVEMIVAYFAPTDGMLRRIARAGKRGRARLIMAAKSDNGATIGAARYTYDRLLWRGVEVYEYVPTKLHSKLVIVDDIVHIGSSNLDLRSLYLNMELMLRVGDGAFAQMMRNYFKGELSQCVRIEPKVQERRATLWNRIRWALSFFLVTTLDYGVTRRLNFGLEGE